MPPARPPSSAAARRQAQAAWREWLQQRKIRPARFQQQAWQAYAEGRSGLITAPTGSGKTLAALGGPLLQAMAEAQPSGRPQGVQLLWVTPLRALAADTSRQLHDAVQHLLPQWRMALRTGDASAKDKRAVQQGQAQLLVTTPESLALLLSHAAIAATFASLRCVIVDEWHELLPSKRGVLLQLNLARLRSLAPQMQVWGVSATIGNMEQALEVLVRPSAADAAATAPTPVLIQDPRHKAFALHSLLPPDTVRLPWAGHIGLANLGQVLQLLMATPTSLLFTNTRKQAELWFSALSSVWPETLSTLALHHGSLAAEERQRVEHGLRQQQLRCVVATSSLDLGVDFPAVDRVIQIGSPHAVARTVQRAGRAKHRPQAPLQLTAVATHALELCELAAIRELAQAQAYEALPPLSLCLDVLSQHAMTMALADGFDSAALYTEVRSTAAFAQLTPAQWEAVLQLLQHGSHALAAYPQYQRLQRGNDGRYVPASARIARQHRWGIGTIVGNSLVSVQFLRGAKLGAVEEAFISKLVPGDVFHFAGRTLELFKVEGLTAWVRRSTQSTQRTPAWSGALLPTSHHIGTRMQHLLAQAVYQPDAPQSPELRYLQPLLALQQQRSHVPAPGTLLIEHLCQPATRQSRSRTPPPGTVLLVYPFAGRSLHEALALLLAHRLAQRQPNTFSWTCNDMGLMLSAAETIDVDALPWPQLLHTEQLAEDLAHAVNFSEIARRRFREIAHIAGMLPARAPGARASQRQLQVSAGLIFDVLNTYDPEHLLLQAARREALHTELHADSLRRLLERLARYTRHHQTCHAHTPFSFGLWAESVRGNLSNESWSARIQRLSQQWSRGA